MDGIDLSRAIGKDLIKETLRRADKMKNMKSEVDRKLYQMILAHNKRADADMRVPSDSEEEVARDNGSELELDNELQILEGIAEREKREEMTLKRQAEAREKK